ncbi:tensin-4 [Bifidobacterium olomucense]|uniref:Tensin-4 n=1 Tax=Bifidobacterium olomucense TaxID=2675324 RepID=A0A7Y0EZN4_9BIFI|nr:tensin-4 [Bifidobacterium sp. DSM 109959]NMM99340.1 tensin-4 [Bifidobacterium sp. DSM 109959]
MRTPTISLRVTDRSGNIIAEIDDLPVPVDITPDGHIIVKPLSPVIGRALSAFAATWTDCCEASL